jgi:hypothetical protein
VNVEVDQQTGGEALQAQVSQELGGVERQEFVDGLDLDDERLLDQEIDDVALGDRAPLYSIAKATWL